MTEFLVTLVLIGVMSFPYAMGFGSGYAWRGHVEYKRQRDAQER